MDTPDTSKKPGSLDLGTDDIDAIAEKLSNGDAAPRTESHNVSSSLTREQLNSFGFNTQQEELDRLKLFPPRGDWEKDDRWTFSVSHNEADSLPGDKMAQGRLFYRFSGYPKPRVVNGVEYKPMFFLRLSPDKRPHATDPGKDDLAYRLFIRAKDLYVSLKGENPTGHGQLITMLEEDNFLLNIMVGTDTNIVILDIKDKPKRR